MVRQVTTKGKKPSWIEVAFVATDPICIEMVADTRMSTLDAVDGSSTGIAMCQIAPAIQSPSMSLIGT